MCYEIRLLDLPNDYEQIANLINMFNKELHRDTVTAIELQKDDQNIPSKNNLSLNESNQLIGFGRHRIVAIDGKDNIIGYAVGWRAPWTDAGTICSILIVDPKFQNKGIGTALLNDLEAWCNEINADLLISEAPDHLNESVLFVEKNGYKKERHVWQSTLDLSQFNEKNLEDLRVGLKEIRIEKLIDVEYDAVIKSLYELFKQTVKDNPAMSDDENSLPTLDDWASECLADSNHVYIANRDNRIIGMTILIPKENGELYNEWTGVDKEFRGQKIALALKLKSIEGAKNDNFHKMRTDNDSLNEGIIKLNQKLGYIPVPGGHFVVSKELKR